MRAKVAQHETTKEWMSCVVLFSKRSRKSRVVSSSALSRFQRIPLCRAAGVHRIGRRLARQFGIFLQLARLRSLASLNASSEKPEEERSRSSSFFVTGATAQSLFATSASLFWAGILSTIAAAGLIWLAKKVGVVGAKPLAELLLALILIRMFPEGPKTGWSPKLVLSLFALGSALSLFWIAVVAWGNTRFPDLSTVSTAAIVTGLLSAVITAPIYEEKVVRHLLLQGLSGYTNRWLAAVLVSAIFAIAHQNAMIWSFFVSLVLCWLAIAKSISVMQRAIVHGTINLLIMLWYFTRGFGLFA